MKSIAMLFVFVSFATFNQARAAQAGKLTPVERAAQRHAALLAGLSQHTMQQLQLPDGAVPPHAIEFAIDLDGVSHTLSLVRRSMRSAGFRVLEDRGDGVLTAVDPGPVRTYRGAVVGAPDASVSAYLHPNGAMNVRIALADATWYVEPAPPAAGPRRHVVYRSADVRNSAGTCAADEGAIGTSTNVAPPARDEVRPVDRGVFREYWKAQIAFDADFEYYEEYGSVPGAQAQIEVNMNDCGDIYKRDVEICYELTTIIVRSGFADPYSDTGNSLTLLEECRDVWNAESYPRATAHLMTGRDLDGDTIGRAYLGGIACDSSGAPDLSLAYGLQEDIVIQSRRTELCAHEIGHNWNACHCDQASCGIVEDCGIMTSSVGPTEGRTSFSPFSRSQIAGWRDTDALCQVQTCGCGTLILVPEAQPFVDVAIVVAPCGSVVSLHAGTHLLIGGVLQTDPGRTVRLEARNGTATITVP